MPTLRAVHPNAIDYDGKRVRVGCQACALLAHLLAVGRRIKVTEVAAVVWGEEEASRGKLDSLVYRVNRKLASVGCDLRAAVDAGNVLLM